MPHPRRLLSLGVCTSVCALMTSLAHAQTESLLIGKPKGDQTKPRASIGAKGGAIVWQDNSIDHNGLGIGFARLTPDGELVPGIGIANVQKIADQENPDVAMLSNGNAAVVWQGGKQGAQQIFLRVLGPKAQVTGDKLANTYFYGTQVNPHIVANSNSILVTWTSYRINKTQPAVYGQFFNYSGVKLGAEFKVNTFNKGVCRGGETAVLSNNRFAAVWIAEDVASKNSVDVFAKIYSPARAEVRTEFKLNTSANLCGSPSLLPSSDGGFVATWSEKNYYQQDSHWNVYARRYDAAGAPMTDPVMLNNPSLGNGYASRLASTDSGILAVWSNNGRDGDREGVIGCRFSAVTLQSEGEEFILNDNTKGSQLNPFIARTATGKLMTLWATPNVGTGFNLAVKQLQ